MHLCPCLCFLLLVALQPPVYAWWWRGREGSRDPFCLGPRVPCTWTLCLELRCSLGDFFHRCLHRHRTTETPSPKDRWMTNRFVVHARSLILHHTCMHIHTDMHCSVYPQLHVHQGSSLLVPRRTEVIIHSRLAISCHHGRFSAFRSRFFTSRRIKCPYGARADDQSRVSR